MQNQPEIICLGQNKTGTSSLTDAFLKVLEWDWKSYSEESKDYKEAYYRFRLKTSVKKLGSVDEILYAASQVPVLKDYPWIKKKVYSQFLKWYPDSKYILTIRDSEDWYNSLYKWCYTFTPDRFKKKILNGENLIIETIKNKARSYNAHLGGKSIEDKEALIAGYNSYNNDIINRFKDCKNFYILKVPEDLNWKTVMNISGLTLPVMKEKLKDLDLDLSKPIEEWEFPHTHNSNNFKQHELPESKQIIFLTE